MITGIIGKKIGMTQVFMEDGRMTPVTVIEAGPCRVVQKKTVGADGYDSVQLGFLDMKESRVNKPMKGHFKKSGTAPAKHLREFRCDTEGVEQGMTVTVDIFAKGDMVSVIGTS
ncbi:MAG TPA: 50S ribosomal protein L3, partial [Nitrospirota bacterium]